MTGKTTFAEPIETQKKQINVLVLSADGLRRDLLVTGISNSSGVAIVESADIGDDDGNGYTPPADVGVAVIDLGQAETVKRGLEIGHDLKSRSENVAIVVLAGSSSILAVVRKHMVEVGPKWSFLSTDLITGLDDLARIIDSAASGMTIVDPGFFADIQRIGSPDSYLTRPLTARQVQVLDLVSQGYNNEVVAGKLEISLRTVEHHLNEAYVSIKNCRSSEINARVYASRIFSECLV